MPYAGSKSIFVAPQSGQTQSSDPEGTLKTTTLIGRVCKRSDALS